jgi:UDP-N-acetylmuramoyl-tripeptide--D-alanyl-D-alanine ligase
MHAFRGVSTDSRNVRKGELFIALRGEKFDGSKFADTAFEEGALCAIVDRSAGSKLLKEKPVIVVKNTTAALAKLANIHRRKFSIPVIAVAGSNGKTTTKEMIATVLATKYNVLSTQGNLNNHIGVPQTLFRLTKNHEIAVIEIGTNHPGELSFLCEILEPTHGIITNIGREHMEFFKTLAGVAKAEGELFTALSRSGLGYINADDKHIFALAKKPALRILYGTAHADVKGKLLRMDASGCPEFSVKVRNQTPFIVRLSVPGKHAMANALAASTVGTSFGVPAVNIQRSLKKFRAVGKRMEVTNVGGITILNDTYNANPDSVISALETLRLMDCRGRKIIILGDMLELGRVSKKEHRQIGKKIERMGFKYLLTFGVMAKYIYQGANLMSKHHYKQKKKLLAEVKEFVKRGDAVLVKGSRGMKMEEVVYELQQLSDRKAA